MRETIHEYFGEDPDDIPNDLLLLGCAYTPQYGDEETTLFKDGEMTQEFADKCVGLPVHIEHDKSKTIGEVERAYINECHQLMTVLHLYGDPVVNKLLPPKLYKNPDWGGKAFYNGLSLGNEVGFKMDYVKDGDYTVKTIANNVPSEVSIVGEGNRPLTEIQDYWILPKNKNVAEYINEVINPFIVRHH